MDWLALIAVALAVLYLGRRARRLFVARAGTSSCGSGDCDPTEPRQQLVQVDLGRDSES